MKIGPLTYRGKENRFNSIDATKYIMAIAVVAIHTNPMQDCNSVIIVKLYNNIVSLAVPFFFVTAGFLLAKKLSFKDKYLDLKVLEGYLWKIVKLYLVWMAIYTPLTIYHNVILKTKLYKFILEYLRGLFFMEEQYNSWPLWYLLSTIYALIVIIYFTKKEINKQKYLIISFVFSIILVAINCFVLMSFQNSGFIMLQRIVKAIISNGRIFEGGVYIPIGMYLYTIHRKIVCSSVMFIIGFVGLYCWGDNEIIGSYLLMVTIIGFFNIIEFVKLQDSKVYPILRNMSTVVYFIHMYVWSFYYMIIYGKKKCGLDSFLFTALVSSVIGVIYAVGWKGQKKKKGMSL